MALEFFDTHCHVHEVLEHLTPVHDKWHSDGAERTAESILGAAKTAGVSRMLVIGTTLADSQLAVRFAQEHEGVWASIGIHPHEAKDHLSIDVKTRFAALAAQDKVVAVGECGLDYFYGHSPKEDQLEVLRFQLDLAATHDLPLSFHVREAFDDFWPVFDEYKAVRGVLHSFTDNEQNMQRAISHGLYIGINGIATFTKDETQRVIYRTIPQHHIVLETDAPFLTPKPFRGTVCEPKHVVNTAEFLANLRGEDLAELAAATTTNARTLFKV